MAVFGHHTRANWLTYWHSELKSFWILRVSAYAFEKFVVWLFCCSFLGELGSFGLSTRKYRNLRRSTSQLQNRHSCRQIACDQAHLWITREERKAIRQEETGEEAPRKFTFSSCSISRSAPAPCALALQREPAGRLADKLQTHWCQGIFLSSILGDLSRARNSQLRTSYGFVQLRHQSRSLGVS